MSSEFFNFAMASLKKVSKEILEKVMNKTKNILSKYKESEGEWRRKKKAMQDEINFFKKILSTDDEITDILTTDN